METGEKFGPLKLTKDGMAMATTAATTGNIPADPWLSLLSTTTVVHDTEK